MNHNNLNATKAANPGNFKPEIRNMARLFVANGYGFGNYWAGYVFAKTTKDPHLLYLSNDKMAILSANMDDEDGEREIIKATDLFSHEELSGYFKLDYAKISNIDWFQPVNIMLLCNEPEKTHNNLIYYTWPAVNLNFVDALSENTIIVHDRFTEQGRLNMLEKEAASQNISGNVEFWSMVKLIALGDRFGELAPKICMESIPAVKNKLKYNPKSFVLKH